MRTLKTSEAAAMLSVSPNTLRAWERRFNYPRPQRTPGHHRAYIHAEVVALRDALQAGLSISSAVSRAREALSGDTSVLVGSLTAYELERADAAMESALALRSVERSVEEVLLPSLTELAGRHGTDSAAWALAARWAEGWLRRAHRLAPPPSRPLTVLIGDATADSLEPDALAIRAFELFSARSGARIVTLPVRRLGGVVEVVTAFKPQAVVLAGNSVADAEVVRWAYQVRLATGAVPVSLFRRGGQSESIRSGALLPEGPYEAHRAALTSAETPAVAAATRPAPTRRFADARRSMA
ncbi:MAG: MerR family DNA-binding transcriptional regulator [Solirubrobacteraceae bacterium]|nr:MerR family DNA-binding transcriptional regulator [Solirubrobacteraceae bacterium]